MSKKNILRVFLALIIVVAGVFFWRSWSGVKQPPEKTSDSAQSQATKPKTEQARDPPAYDTTTPESITFIVNKQLPLGSEYAPADLMVPTVPLRLSGSEQQMHFRKVAEADLEQLFKDAKTAGLGLVFGSGYRSFAVQKSFYNGYVNQSGQASADTFSARPGHSEHQTGLALDFTRSDGNCHLNECFERTAEGKWLAANAQNYGFILRYPKDKQAITGYNYEPWHFRYLGVETAKKVFGSNQTLEEFFGLGPAPDYKP